MTDNTLILSSQGKAGSTHLHHLLDEVATVEVGAESDTGGQGRVSIGGAPSPYRKGLGPAHTSWAPTGSRD